MSAATKIINVLRTDGFEDILDVFKSAKADEVIFVLPKKSKALARQEHFIALAAIAQSLGKNVSIMSPDPLISKMAESHKFHVLSSPTVQPRKRQEAPVARLAVADEDLPEDVDIEPEDTDDLEDEEGTTPAKAPGDLDDAHPEEVPLEEAEKDDTDDATLEDEEEFEPLFDEEPDYSKDIEELEDISIKERNKDQYQIVTASYMGKTMADILRPIKDEGISLKVTKKPERDQHVDIQRDEQPVGRVDQQALDEIKKVWQSGGDLWTNHNKDNPRKSFESKHPTFATPKINSRFLSKSIAIWLAAGAFLLFAGVVYFSVGEARLVLKPQSQNVDFDMQVSASDKFASVNTEDNQIPGQMFNAGRQHDGTYSATGERDVAQKARGTITVHNDLDTAQALIATTRFESSNGLIFRTLTSINVPAKGKIAVEIIADRPGDLYNVGAGKFTIPAFKEKSDTARYNGIYGQSTQPMKGGIVGKAKVVTETDFNKAKTDAETKAIAAALEEIKSQSTGLTILDLPNPAIKDSESTARIDEAVESTFNYKAFAEVKALGFKEDNLMTLINDYLGRTNDLNSFKDRLEFTYRDVKLDSSTGTLSFTVKVSGEAFKRIDTDGIKKDLIGKSRQEVKAYIDAKENIATARVSFNPFWVRKVPMDPEQFKVEIGYDNTN